MADLRHLLAIYVHAHQTGNSVPPHIDAEARAALAAEPPAPAEPDTDAVLTLAAIIREAAGNGLPGAARLAELILSHPNVASVFQSPAPAPAADGEPDHVPGAGNMVPAAYAARLRQCPTHGQLPANAWGCPECLRELREELARLRGSAADGEREELAQWLEDEAVYYEGLSTEASAKATRAAALLRESRPQQGWQPIDSAPQDGTEILASDYDAIEIVNWGWDGWGNRDGSIMFPAWWQPLPEQPRLPQPPQGGEVES